MKKLLILLIYIFLFLIGLSAQNTKPFALPDTLTLNLNDSGSINLLLNDYDQQGDQMKITKFDRFSFLSFKTFKNDTGIFTITKYGLLSVRAKKAGIFTYKYIVQDGKAGAGRVGYFVLKVKDKVTTEPLKFYPYCHTLIIPDTINCKSAWVSSITGIYLYGTLNDTSAAVPAHFRYGIKGDKIYSEYPYLPNVTIRTMTWFSLLSLEQYLFIANGCK